MTQKISTVAVAPHRVFGRFPMRNPGNSASNPAFAKTKPSLRRFFPLLASAPECPPRQIADLWR
ncbi:MAG: hypothetical protein U1E20_11010 [Methylocystis sp.]|uniref:hypothetical protein n=1 Tax=Methylocystis sp. TaxID=1911079 RepID=UPI00394A1988